MPGEWKTTALGDVALFEMGQAPPSQFVSDSRNGFAFLQGNAEFGVRYPSPRLFCSKPSKLSKSNDILISVRAPVGETNVSDCEYAIGRGLAAIRFKGLIPEFGWHAIRFAATELNKVAQGSTFQAIGKYELGRLQVPNPPLPEQRRIAEILDTLDRTIEATQRIIEKLQATRQGLLHDLLSRGLDAKGKLRDPERHPEQFHETELGLLPREWEVLPIGELGGWHGGSTPSKRSSRFWQNGVYPWITPKDFKNSFLDSAEDFVSEEGARQLTVYPANSLLVVFRSGVLRHTLPLAISRVSFTVNQDVKVLLENGNVLPAFVMNMLQFLEKQLLGAVVKVGTTVESVDTKAFLEFRIALPSRPEQERILALLDSIRWRRVAEQEKLGKLQALKRGLMENLLTGRVRVPITDSEHKDSSASRVVRPTDPANSADVPLYIPPQPPVAAHAPMYRAAAGAQAKSMTQWTRQLAEAVQGQQVGLYSPEALDAVLPELLALTIDRHGLLRVPEVLAKAGIRFMLLPHPDGSKANGAAFYLDEKRRQPVVGLSLRFPYLDVFWFNLLHELAHIRLGHQPVPDESLEQYDQHSPDEQAANRWAQDTLIPPQDWQELYARHPVSDQQLLALARKLGRHVAIVAGRYGHETGNWGRVNSPKLRPSAVAELKELGQQLKGKG